MDKISRILLYGEEPECQIAAKLLADLSDTVDAHIHQTNNWLDFQIKLVEWNPSLTLILAEGQEAKTGIVVAKRTRPEMPVFWFSEDAEQSIKSHALECDYFGIKPVTKEHLEKAFRRCAYIGIEF